MIAIFLAPAKTARRGFTLIEVLCVIVLIGVFAGISTLLLRELLEVERSQARSFDQTLRTNELADLFRADVARAEKSLPAWKHFQASPKTLILQMQGGNHVIYSLQEGELGRSAFEGQKMSTRRFPVDSRRIRLEFVQADLTTWTRFGGWTTAYGKQYGSVGSIDYDVFDEAIVGAGGDMDAAERQELQDLRVLVGTIQGPWVQAARSAITGAMTTPQKRARNAILEAALDALTTIQNGG